MHHCALSRRNESWELHAGETTTRMPLRLVSLLARAVSRYATLPVSDSRGLIWTLLSGTPDEVECGSLRDPVPTEVRSLTIRPAGRWRTRALSPSAAPPHARWISSAAIWSSRRAESHVSLCFSHLVQDVCTDSQSMSEKPTRRLAAAITTSSSLMVNPRCESNLSSLILCGYI